jgi:uncharacterized membrane protein YtjA (UPF0391 family)
MNDSFAVNRVLLTDFLPAVCRLTQKNPFISIHKLDLAQALPFPIADRGIGIPHGHDATGGPSSFITQQGWIREIRKRKENVMLYWAVVFFIIAMVAAVFGFFGIAAAATEIAKILFFVFLVLFVVSLIFGLRGRSVQEL